MARKRKKSGCLGIIGFVFSVVLLVGAGLYFWLTIPYQGYGAETFVDLSKGTGTSAMADQLAEAKVIRSRWQWLLVRALNPTARLQAGEYRFSDSASVWSVFDRIHRGDVFYYEVTIPEGSNLFDIAGSLNQLGFIKTADFLKVARSPALIRDLAPDAPSLEGYLFPSTYRLTRSTTATQICRQMTDVFRHKWAELAGGQTDVNRTVALASLVEKETGVPADRPVVASVFVNRLNKGMTLDCDPTTIYASILASRYRGVIHRSDLDSTSPYNTYRHAGLPPGPIANPGVASLKAALHPAETEYLYFVATPDGSGSHNFSKTLAEHSKHVKEYRGR